MRGQCRLGGGPLALLPLLSALATAARRRFRRGEQAALLSALVAAPAFMAPVPCAAWGVRGELRATASYLEYRTVVRDSLPESEVPGDGTTRRLPDGTIVTCIPGGYCYWYRAGSVESASPMMQDLSLTAWPGWRGVSARVHLRSRLGSDSFWPKSTREIEALNAWVDFDRPAFRLRAGRQEKGGGLGYYYFDGGSVLWKGRSDVRVEAFLGRSLARTLLGSHTSSLLKDADQLSPDKPSLLWGLEGRYRRSTVFSTSLLYQREIRTDRAGLYSERVALDARWAPRLLTTDLSADFDVATGAFNEARLRLSRGLRSDLDVALQGRYYRPFFELWTIWGAFSPVGYSEAEAQAYWTARPGLRLNARAAWRDYEETHTGAEFAPIEGDGWRLASGADWNRSAWTVAARLGVQGGYGAWRSQLDTSAGRHFGPDRYAGVFAAGTQQFAEFRFGEGTTRGAGLEARAAFGDVTLDGRLGIYRHTFDNRPGFDDYSQFRGMLGLSWRFGTEPVATTVGPAAAGSGS